MSLNLSQFARALRRGALVATGIAAAALLAGCERPPMQSTQGGYRGTAMDHVANPRLVAAEAGKHVAPPSDAPASAEGPKAGQVYQNVKVLGDLSVGEFTRLMVAMTAWVSPEQGCNYCHNPQNLADDSKYTKVVARRMVEMTQHINADWKTHVANTGVTCYTCHRGNPVPSEVWFQPAPLKQDTRMAGSKAGQNTPAMSVAWASLPYDPLSEYLRDSKEIRVNTATALPSGNKQNIKQTEFTYSLMMHMSDSLGVNCTFCHNSRQFSDWSQSPPARLKAWHGIRMARDLNKEYLEGLTKSFPAERLGPLGDVAKVNCATCHQGVNKPLNGAKMLEAHPELAAHRPYNAAAVAPTAAPAAGAAPAAAAAVAAAPAAKK